MIPPLDARGLLPPGQHECARLADLALHFAINARRVALFQNLEKFLRTELSLVAAGLDLYVGGSYLSDKPHPSDIDCTLSVPLKDIAAYGPLMQLSADGAKGRIYTTYGVEFYLTIGAMGLNDFRLFFSYVGEKTAHAKNLDAKDSRGIIKVLQWTPQ